MKGISEYNSLITTTINTHDSHAPDTWINITTAKKKKKKELCVLLFTFVTHKISAVV